MDEKARIENNGESNVSVSAGEMADNVAKASWPQRWEVYGICLIRRAHISAGGYRRRQQNGAARSKEKC